MVDDVDYLVVAFGMTGRIAKSAVTQARAAGLKVGLFRPITLWPYPEAALKGLVQKVRGILVVEMNAGQMLEDVERIVEGRSPVRFLGRMGGTIPLPDEILGQAIKAYIVPASRAQLTKEHVLKCCADKMENFMVPKYVEFLDELPRTANGKIDKKLLKAEGPSAKTVVR